MDIKHNYIDTGSGKTLILLHGNNDSLEYFHQQIEAFSPFYRVVALDTRGHGKTPRGNAPFTLVQFAEDLFVFMKRLHIKKAHILGFSDGANIAIAFALKYPRLIDKLILDGGNIFPEGIDRETQQPIEDAYYEAMEYAFEDAEARAKAEMLGLMVNEPHYFPQDLQAITAQTLVMAGDHDLILPEHTQLIHDSIPGSQLAIIPGSHFVAAENPDEYNAAVLSFLQD